MMFKVLVMSIIFGILFVYRNFAFNRITSYNVCYTKLLRTCNVFTVKLPTSTTACFKISLAIGNKDAIVNFVVTFAFKLEGASI